MQGGREGSLECISEAVVRVARTRGHEICAAMVEVRRWIQAWDPALGCNRRGSGRGKGGEVIYLYRVAA